MDTTHKHTPGHTPGPWSADWRQEKFGRNARGSWYFVSAVGTSSQRPVMLQDCMEGDPECRANARLIASAPMLLKLLAEAVDIADPMGPVYDNRARASWMKEARAAIAAAEGDE